MAAKLGGLVDGGMVASQNRFAMPVTARTQQDDQAIIALGRSVIEAEAAAVAVVADALGESFARAVSLMLMLHGRVVVTGMGKSGHVGRKVAATLASTGSPALFLHPAEAAHGDLGMLVPGDMLLVLSNSGRTSELRPILARATLLGIPVVAITSDPDSPLVDRSDLALLLPPTPEACPINLAPTTSTAMMMAMGDALAIAAMRARGVSREGFEALHPGGAIGVRLTRVEAVMHRGMSVPLVAATAPMRDVILTMTERSFGIAGVVDGEGHLVGVITDGDLRRHIAELFESTAADVMTHDPVTILSQDLVEDALALMNERKVTALFVTREDDWRRPIGIVHVHDFLRLGFE